MKQSRIVLLCAVALLVMLPGSANAAWYAKFDGVDGSSQADSHDGWVDVISVSPPLTKGASGPGVVVLVVNDEKALPKITEAVANGKVFKRVLLDYVPEDGDPQAYLEVRLHNAKVVSYSISAAGDDGPFEMEVEYAALLPVDDDPAAAPGSLSETGDAPAPRR